jgi:asparagine synthase (glutamine-hydrolysing)
VEVTELPVGTWTERLQGKDPIMAALSFDRSSYLPDDLNVKMDRATMAHGLEARAPFLDQELVRFVSSLPTEWLLHRGRGKYILKEALKGVVPKEVLSRKKRGFQVPLARWFRGELRPLIVERCLASGSSLQQVCDPVSVKRLLEENDRGTDHGNRLWMLLTLATWLNKNS